MMLTASLTSEVAAESIAHAYGVELLYAIDMLQNMVNVSCFVIIVDNSLTHTTTDLLGLCSFLT